MKFRKGHRISYQVGLYGKFRTVYGTVINPAHSLNHDGSARNATVRMDFQAPYENGWVVPIEKLTAANPKLNSYHERTQNIQVLEDDFETLRDALRHAKGDVEALERLLNSIPQPYPRNG